MSLASKLETLEVGDETPKIAIKDLTDPKGYKILVARRVDTRFNRPAILLEIDLEEDGSAVTFLPSRFVVALSDDDLTEITAARSYRVCSKATGGNSPDVRIWSEEATSKKKSSRR